MNNNYLFVKNLASVATFYYAAVIWVASRVLPVHLSDWPSVVRAGNSKTKQESRGAARKPRDAAAVLFGL